MAKYDMSANELVKKWEVFSYKNKQLLANTKNITVDLLKKFFVNVEAASAETAATSGSSSARKRARQSSNSATRGPSRYGQTDAFDVGSPAMKSASSKRLSFTGGETTYTVDTIHNLKRPAFRMGGLEAAFGLVRLYDHFRYSFSPNTTHSVVESGDEVGLFEVPLVHWWPDQTTYTVDAIHNLKRHGPHLCSRGSL